jgi:hypothetical protein
MFQTTLSAMTHAALTALSAAGDPHSAPAPESGGARLPLLLVAAVLGAGFVFHRFVVPLIRATIHVLEWVAEVALKVGLGLMAAGAVAAVVLVLYAVSAVGGNGAEAARWSGG